MTTQSTTKDVKDLEAAPQVVAVKQSLPVSPDRNVPLPSTGLSPCASAIGVFIFVSTVVLIVGIMWDSHVCVLIGSSFFCLSFVAAAIFECRVLTRPYRLQDDSQGAEFELQEGIARWETCRQT